MVGGLKTERSLRSSNFGNFGNFVHTDLLQVFAYLSSNTVYPEGQTFWPVLALQQAQYCDVPVLISTEVNYIQEHTVFPDTTPVPLVRDILPL